MNIYVDGSWSSNYPDKAAWAFVTETGIAYRGIIPNPASRQIDAELAATSEATLWALTHRIPKVNILYDYEGVRCFATGEWKAKKPVAILYQSFMSYVMKYLPVTFQKTEANPADTLATDLLGIKSKHPPVEFRVSEVHTLALEPIK